MVGVGGRFFWRRAALGIFGVAAVAAVMTGCEDSPPAELSVMLEGDSLLVTNCGVVAHGEVKVRMSATVDGQFDSFFVGSVDDWATGEVLSPSSDRWTRVETDESPLLAPGERLTISYYGTDAGGRVAYFTVPKRGIPENGWLHPNDTVTFSACAE